VSEYEEFESEEQGLKGQREHIKRLEAELKAERERTAQAQAEREAVMQAARAEAVKGALTSHGLPAGLAGVFPGDIEPTAEAVQQWANDLGLQAQRNENPAPPTDMTSVERYAQMVAVARGGSTRPQEEGLLDEGLRGVIEAGKSPYLPSEKDLQDAKDFASRVNRENRRISQMVQMGRAEPNRSGFGGLTDPPAWANRTLQIDD